MVRGLIPRALGLLAAALLPLAALAQSPHTIGPLQAQNNLADLDNAATARTNLGLGSAATIVLDGNPAHYLNGAGGWGTPSGGSAAAGGSSGQLQYNNGGALAGLTLGGDCSLDTSTGVATCTKTGGVAFGPLATAAVGSGLVVSAGTLSIALPSATTLGGVESLAPAAHLFLTGISTSGVPQAAQPAAADISGLAASATVDTTNAGNITSGTLSPARLPTPTASTLGAVESLAPVAHQFLTGVSTSGAPQAAQPAAADISGLAPSATVDTTNAGNITSGTLGAARLPTPTASTLGAVESLAPVAHQFLTGVSTSGAPQAAQPAAADISGLAPSATVDTTNAGNITSGTLSAARLPTPTASTLGAVESLAPVAHQFLTGISTSGAPQAAQPAAADISGLAASATTDTTNASNIGSGTLSSARLPPGAYAPLGGYQSGNWYAPPFAIEGNGTLANYTAYAYPFVALANGTIKAIGFNIPTGWSQNFDVIGAIYADQSGMPAAAAPLAQTSSSLVAHNGSYSLTLTASYQVTVGTRYWIVLMTDTPGNAQFTSFVASGSGGTSITSLLLFGALFPGGIAANLGLGYDYTTTTLTLPTSGGWGSLTGVGPAVVVEF